MPLEPPVVLTNGTDADADQVMDIVRDLYSRLEGVANAESPADVYQAGVLVSTDWALTASGGTINPATGALTYPAVGGALWAPGPAGSLVRTFTAPATLKDLPLGAAKPAEGKYRRIGVELGLTGGVISPSVVGGPERAAEGEAVADTIATTAGKVRVHEFVVHLAGGVYSASAGRDRRPWARGALAFSKLTSGTITVVGTAAITALAMRLECSGRPVELKLMGSAEVVGGAYIGLGFRMDGATVDGTEDGAADFLGVKEATVLAPITVSYVFQPAAGSHLFVPTTKQVTGGSGEIVRASATHPLLFSVRELLPSANNGTT